MPARILLACVVIAGLASAAPASAETVAPPELPPGQQPGWAFTDNPAIVDAHPLPVEGWSRHGDDTLAVHFTTGSPECFGVHATAQETPRAVTVELVGGSLPEPAGRACTMIAVSGSLDVPLQSPLGDRDVLSVS